MSRIKNKNQVIKKNIEIMNNKDDWDDVSDGWHTFGGLYNQRLYLWAALVNAYSDKAWKTKRDENGKAWFDDSDDINDPENHFLVTISTPAGDYGYHYHNKDWDMFHCKEIDKAKPFDGYTDKDVDRILSLETNVNILDMEI